MLYTKGIRKIFQAPTCFAGRTMQEIFGMANAAGYRAVFINGMVYVKIGISKWEQTVFNIGDFSTED